MRAAKLRIVPAKGSFGSRGLTLTELLVVIPITAFVAATLLALLSKAEFKAQGVQGANHCRQSGVASKDTSTVIHSSDLTHPRVRTISVKFLLWGVGREWSPPVALFCSRSTRTDAVSAQANTRELQKHLNRAGLRNVLELA